MYIPAQFAETRIDVMHQLMREHSLGTLVMLGEDGLQANHIPFEIVEDGSPFGTLQAHVARSNPLWRQDAGIESLVVFQGAQAYISPSLYATKKEHGKVVPTYNYMAVHAHGRLRAVEDPEWVRGLLDRLSARHEAGREAPWAVGDAPAEFIDALLKQIVGIEIEITRLEGKWKVSQNQPQRNRISVEAGLREQGDEASVAMAEAVGLRGG
ncbi:FMN-binding negative transcriptional regulator [Noviherbaspirillum malthae]|uniref:FMN-binding negative transcriptional regulator n=1 Tax=Noviherbaspirillum malthae TaxID=1260987 RepID=UPI00188F52BC|nr:FMN-binding negative transcriptional regulator [Noviherbaspirillum malthae]